ncbi:alpha/beta fold hydrolase [uncultured Tateyamaria sp.]|uniref:alpha/beta hydrolase n=1 Tax=uncultured Tateyamaria sp. TaxID=455651 RepID=UPI002624FEEB|nr:alpha/beta fold hydrolase [uncultured Tateyamaria sp.]
MSHVTLAALGVVLAALTMLEWVRVGVETTRSYVGNTPITRYAQPGSTGPVVVIAHGFAGSQQMMNGFALPLARAGYRVVSFDFEGHGRNRVPMSGDLTVVDGTTQVLVAQTRAVMDAVAVTDAPIALLGHSMATDILVRAAQRRVDVGPIVLVSAFSQAIDDQSPQTLLLVSGAWEGRLRAFGLEAAQMVDPQVREGQTARNGAVTRKAAAAPFSEHVSVLHAREARAEAVAWLDEAYGRKSAVTIWPTGWALLGLLAGLVVLFRTIVRVVPTQAAPRFGLSTARFVAITCAPMLFAPLIAAPLNFGVLPVLVADYLMLHLCVFGGLQLVLLGWWGVPLGGMSWRGFGVLLAWSALFCAALDRYAANFWPTPERFWIIAVMSIGAVPYMLADAALVAGAPLWRRVMLRLSVLVSLGIAVALDFEGLFFLIMIAPVLVLFYLVFGTMGRLVSARTGPLAAGLALGLVLAWALGVSFPMFQA